MAITGISLDTNAYGAVLRSQPEAVEIVRRAPAIGVSTVVLGELLGGFAAGTRYDENLENLERFLASKRVTVLPVDRRTSDYYAVIYRDLRLRGKPIPTNDMWIAASAFRHGMAVFTYDPHFRRVEGLVAGQTLDDFLA